MKWLAPFFFAAVLSSQIAPVKHVVGAAPVSSDTTSEPTKSVPSNPSRDPKERARELLESAAGGGGSRPEATAFAMVHIAEAYSSIDKKRSVELIRNAFAIATELKPETRAVIQQAAIRTAAQQFPDEALSLLQQMPSATAGDNRIGAAESLVDVFLSKKRVDAALQVVALFDVTGSYPHRAVGKIIRALPQEDERRLSLFSTALTAYTIQPRGLFPDLLLQLWSQLPPKLAQSSLDAVINAIVDRKDTSGFSMSMSGEKGTVNFESRNDYDLFKLMKTLREIEPDRAAEILEHSPSLAAMVKQYPDGISSLRGDGAISSVRGTGKKAAQSAVSKKSAEMYLANLSRTRAEAAESLIDDDPGKALSMVETIPSVSDRVEVLGAVAAAVGESDPGRAKQIISRCMKMLDDLKDVPQERSAAWLTLATSAKRLNDDQTAWAALYRAIADSGDLYKKDSNSDDPNTAPIDFWPSTQNYRNVVSLATSLFGVDAEPLLAGISDPDIGLLARVEMAQELLGRKSAPSRTIQVFVKGN